MFPLVDRTPKCLLPVANRPMLSFQLEFLERPGFSNCLVISHERCNQPQGEIIQQGKTGLNPPNNTLKVNGLCVLTGATAV
jgi:NDP-sugar pyrophosphorylase family protein